MANAKKTSTAKPLAQTVSRFGRRYKKEACSTTKSAATAKTESLRKAGFTAMTLKDSATGKFCTFRGKKAASAITGTKKRKTTTTRKAR